MDSREKKRDGWPAGLICCCLLFITFQSFGQLKYEKESRIKSGEVPMPARKFIAELGIDSKIKWYAELSLEGRSFEAKTRYQKRKYSIEFDTLGQLEDLEVEIGWEEMPVATRNAICEQLYLEFSTFKLIKVQQQYRDPPLIYSHLQSGELPIGHSKFELVIKGRSNEENDWYEYLFTDEGALEKKSTLVFRNTDNLEF